MLEVVTPLLVCPFHRGWAHCLSPSAIAAYVEVKTQELERYDEVVQGEPCSHLWSANVSLGTYRTLNTLSPFYTHIRLDDGGKNHEFRVLTSQPTVSSPS